MDGIILGFMKYIVNILWFVFKMFPEGLFDKGLFPTRVQGWWSL